MNYNKISAALWIIAAICFFIAGTLFFGNTHSLTVLLLYTIICILFLINAYLAFKNQETESTGDTTDDTTDNTKINKLN